MKKGFTNISILPNQKISEIFKKFMSTIKAGMLVYKMKKCLLFNLFDLNEFVLIVHVEHGFLWKTLL